VAEVAGRKAKQQEIYTKLQQRFSGVDSDRVRGSLQAVNLRDAKVLKRPTFRLLRTFPLLSVFLSLTIVTKLPNLVLKSSEKQDE
jgi:hypothetical protein